ncbi:MAG TPA: glucan biosynthesis protein G [Candidatus Limnocylindria bacterium]|nr:glucan biosynthesis protein G [Candidatus Limnocylindria bacterium]
MKTAWRCAWVLVLGAGSVLARTTPFDFEALQQRARAMAGVAYEAPVSTVPEGLKKFNYDDYQMINFDGAHSWWRREGLPFELQFFHPGWLYTQTVQVNELAHGESTRIPFTPEFFRYGGRKPWHVPTDMGFAGFRVLNALNRRDKMDELAVFLGASYFRALGRDMRYGLSARGIAVNTAEPGGEEFPSFREFWVERPVAGANALTLYALMDGPSVTGAYRFVITPGADTVVRVRAVVFCRKNPQVFGVAPLTSMFAHGENTGWAPDDYRPEVHDSDGLLVATGTGEWIWRPLANPRTVRVASFLDRTPRGFGLLQRDRVFEHYDDLEAYYQQRPSAWVEPVGDWGAGSVRLVELPTPDETNDNIVAFWVPAQLPAPGEPITFEYNLHWFMDPDRRPPAGFVTSTRTAAVMGRPALRRFVLEFAGPYLRREPDDSAIEAVVSVVSGAQQDGAAVVQKNRFSGTWRVAFEIAPEAGGKPVELRCFLRKGQHVLTETWSYLWNP